MEESAVQQADVDDKEEEARIARDLDAVGANVDAGTAFAAAVAALKSRLIPAVTDEDVAELESLIHRAQQILPDDKQGFVRDVRRMLEAGGLRLVLEGEDAAVKLGMKNGSIQLVVGKRGSTAFQKAVGLGVERIEEPAFASWKPQDKRDRPSEGPV